MSDLLTTIDALTGTVLAAIGLTLAATVVTLAVCYVRADDEPTDRVEADDLRGADDQIFAAVEQARADIDAIPDGYIQRRIIAHPCGLAWIETRVIDTTDLQRAETPADIWRTA